MEVWTFMMEGRLPLPFFFIDGCHSFQAGPVLDLSGNRLRALNPTFGNIKRDVNNGGYCSRGQPDAKFPHELQGWILDKHINKEGKEEGKTETKRGTEAPQLVKDDKVMCL